MRQQETMKKTMMAGKTIRHFVVILLDTILDTCNDMTRDVEAEDEESEDWATAVRNGSFRKRREQEVMLSRTTRLWCFHERRLEMSLKRWVGGYILHKIIFNWSNKRRGKSVKLVDEQREWSWFLLLLSLSQVKQWRRRVSRNSSLAKLFLQYLLHSLKRL